MKGKKLGERKSTDNHYRKLEAKTIIDGVFGATLWLLATFMEFRKMRMTIYSLTVMVTGGGGDNDPKAI